MFRIISLAFVLFWTPFACHAVWYDYLPDWDNFNSEADPFSPTPFVKVDSYKPGGDQMFNCLNCGRWDSREGLNNFARTAANLVYGKDPLKMYYPPRFPWQDGTLKPTPLGENWHGLKIRTDDGHVTVKARMSGDQKVRLKAGQHVVVKLQIVHVNGIAMEILIEIRPGLNYPIIPPEPEGIDYLDDISFKAEASVMSMGYIIGLNQRYGYGIGDWFYSSPGDCWPTETGVMCSPF